MTDMQYEDYVKVITELIRGKEGQDMLNLLIGNKNSVGLAREGARLFTKDELEGCIVKGTAKLLQLFEEYKKKNDIN